MPTPHVPTDEDRVLVETLSGLGIPQVQICALMMRGQGISLDTLLRHYRTEVTRGRARANREIAETLYQKAKNGDNACLIFWAKSQLGWRETQRHEIAGHDGGQLIQRIERVIVDPSQADTRDDDSRAEHTAH